jgi:hypothetical protein
MYVDLDEGGRIRDASEITEAEVELVLDRAVQAVASASPVLDAEVQARLADPPAEATELAEALARAVVRAPHTDFPEDVVKVMLDAVSQPRASFAR